MPPGSRVDSRIKLHDVRIFMAVVHAGSMGKAARQLNAAQPNISKSIADLESVLGVRLLERHRQGVEPTAYGRALLECGTAIFDELRQGLNNIDFLADPAAGELRIGSSAFLGASFVSAVIDRLSLRYPRIVFHVSTGPTETMQRALSERKLDVLILRGFGLTADERLGFESLFDDSFVVAAGAKNKWAGKRKIELADLTAEAWVLPPPESSIWSVATEAFRVSGLEFPAATVVAVLPEIRISLLTTGRFLSIFPASVLKFPRRPEIKVLAVDLPVARVPVGIVTLKNRTPSPVTELFAQYAREVAKPLSGRK